MNSKVIFLLFSKGWNDLKGIAEDYKKVYPELLGREYEPSKFLVNNNLRLIITSANNLVEFILDFSYLFGLV